MFKFRIRSTDKRNYLWTLNRRLRKIGFELQRFPKRAFLSEFIPEVQRITAKIDPNQLDEVSPLFLGFVLAAKRGLLVNSQLGQDAFVLGALSGVPGPFFYLEIGAYHPRDFSNTALLRDYGGWLGLSVDPNPNVAASFAQYSLSQSFIEVAVGATEGVVTLVENGALSSVQHQQDNLDHHYNVRMTTPKKLIENLPVIDYLSLDIEGGELEVLQNWPWGSSKPTVITVEHNNRVGDMNSIRKLLLSQGYKCVLAEVTEFENWFILDV